MTEKLIILAVSVVLWFMIIKKWEKEELVKKVRNWDRKGHQNIKKKKSG